MLVSNPAARDFVADAFAHLKFIERGRCATALERRIAADLTQGVSTSLTVLRGQGSNRIRRRLPQSPPMGAREDSKVEIFILRSDSLKWPRACSPSQGFNSRRAPTAKGQVAIAVERCKGCGFCVEFCPTHVLALSSAFNSKGYHPPHVVAGEKCSGCDLCGMYCPDFAIFGARNAR
jgi:2-oxoglutarate ferredoxin oxidoreductase subunit delta